MMTPDRYRKAGEIYDAALALPRDRRTEFIDQACDGDADLRREVESLLAAHDEAGRFIEGAPQRLNSLLQAIATPSPPIPDDADDDQDASSADVDESSRNGESSQPEMRASVLVPGQHVGRYEILDVLGSGGMGTVYRALDHSLGREVAIKALAHTFRGDWGSLRRFEREARVLATLSHPNIATIFGVERLDDSMYLVLERVDGETLAERLRRGALRLEETIRVAEQIIAGLEEAHGKGVIHRDLKPSNVMLSADGRVKLVDFGLAKTAHSTAPRGVPAEPITAEGVVLGTARYMSPEQVRGEHVDMRTDVWAFGCVLYEMLTGRPVFEGRSVSEVVAAVLRDEPDWQALPTDTPPNIRRLLRRCLAREPRSRLQHIGDARLDLVEIDDAIADADVARQARQRRRALMAIAAAVIVGLVAFIVFGLPRGAQNDPVPARLSLELPARLTLASEFSTPYAVAPDGSRVVFEGVESGISRLYVRELTGGDVRVLAGTEGARQPFFSPDGAWVGFFANRKLSKVPVDGGAVLPIADIGGNLRGVTWAPGTVVFSAPQIAGLSRVADGGGKPIPLTTLNTAAGESSHRWPDVVLGSEWVLFTVGLEDASYDEGRIEAVSLVTGERRVLFAGAGFARYLPSRRRLLFVRAGHIYAVEFDPERLELRGTPEVVFDPVRYDVRNGGTHLAVSASGVVAYGPGPALSSEYYLSWVDRDGRVTRATDTARPFRHIRLSFDGQRIATVIGTSTESDLWLVDANGTLSRLSFGLAPHRPTWMPNGHGITVSAQRGGRWQILTVPAAGNDDPNVLFESQHRLYPNAWSPDGRFLLFQESRPETGWDLYVLEVDASGNRVGEAKAFANTPFHEMTGAISRDGHWVAYESDEVDGVYDIYVRSFPDGQHKRRVSSDGTRGPLWDTQGQLHYWQTPDEDRPRMVRTTPQGGELSVGAPQAIWRRRPGTATANRIVNPVVGGRYDLDPTGARFLALETPDAGPGADLTHPVIVLGWRPSGQPR